MGSRFAGSRTVDDRRRRRLASGAHSAAADGDDVPIGGSTGESDSGDSDAPQMRNADVIPIRKLIPPGVWKTSLIAVGVLAVAMAVDQYPGRFAADPSPLPAVVTLPTPDGQALTRFCESVLLLACAQLAILIGWSRSQSANDFEGRYRIWYCSAALLFGAGFCVGSGSGISPGIVFAGSGGQVRASLAVWLWLGVSTTICCAAAASVFQDSWRSVVSRWALALTGCLSAASLLGPHLVPAGLLNSVVPAGAALFATLLLHARYVVWVNRDPPGPNTGPAGVLRRLRRAMLSDGDEESGLSLMLADSPADIDETQHPEPDWEQTATGNEASCAGDSIAAADHQTSAVRLDESTIEPKPKSKRRSRKRKSQRGKAS